MRAAAAGRERSVAQTPPLWAREGSAFAKPRRCGLRGLGLAFRHTTLLSAGYGQAAGAATAAAVAVTADIFVVCVVRGGASRGGGRAVGML